MLSITVDTLVDENDGPSGNVSFREALAMAADVNHPGHDTIDFSPALFNNGPATITLTHDGPDAGSIPDELSINSNVTIEGPGAELLTEVRTIVGLNDLTSSGKRASRKPSPA
jgi:hypothetical protein